MRTSCRRAAYGLALCLASLPVCACLARAASAPGPRWVVERVGDLPAGAGDCSVDFVDPTQGWLWCRSSTHRFWRTADGGSHWQELPLPSTDLPIPFNVDNAHFFDAKVGWVQIVDEVFWTHDGGDTWSRQPIPGRHSIPDVSSGVLMSVWFSRSGEVGWAAGGDFRWAEPGEEAPNYAVERDSSGRRAIERPAIYRTEDSGRSWQEQTLPGPYRGYHASLYVRDAQHALAVTEEDTFYTRDGGRRWYKGQFGKGCTSSRFFTSDPGKIWTAHLLSKSEAWIAFSGGRLFHTLDGGGRWCELAPGIPGARLDYLHFASATIGLSVNPFIALYETRDGGETWTDLRTGPRVYSMFFLDATDGWLVAREGLYRVTLR